MEENFKYCYKCGQKLPIDANFCDKCGTSQSIDLTNIEVKEEKNISKPNVLYNNNSLGTLEIVCKAFLFGLSILLVLFTFLPNMSIKSNTVNQVGFNSYNAIEFMFDSYYSLSNEELTQSDLYKEYLEAEALYLMIPDKNGRLFNIEETFKLYNYNRLQIKCSLRREGVLPSIELILCGLFSFVYIVFLIGFMILAFFNFLGIFKEKYRKLDFISKAVLVLIPVIAFIVYYLNASYLAGAVYTEIGLGVILTLIGSVGAIVLEGCKTFVYMDADVNNKDLILNFAKICLCILILICTITPFTISKIEHDHRNNKYVEIDNSIFSFYNFNYTDEDEVLFKEWQSYTFEEAKKEFFGFFYRISSQEKIFIEYGILNSVNILLLKFAAASTGGYKTTFPIFASIPIVVLLGLIFVMIIFQQSLLYLLTGRSSKLVNVISGISQAILFIMAFSFTLEFYFVVQKQSIELYCDKMYELKVGFGVILLFVCTFLLVVCTLLHSKNKKKYKSKYKYKYKLNI